MSSSLNDYFEALDRLKRNEPQVVAKNTKITNDAVALEARRQKGSIKKSRAVFGDLILAIEDASNEQSKALKKPDEQVDKLKSDVSYYKKAWEDALAREISLLNEVFELRKKLSELNGSNVFPIKK